MSERMCACVRPRDSKDPTIYDTQSKAWNIDLACGMLNTCSALLVGYYSCGQLPDVLHQNYIHSSIILILY